MLNPREQYNDWKLRRAFRRAFSPTKTETVRAKERFAALLPQTRIHRHVIQWRYAMVAGLIVASSLGGIATYADQANVPPTHPLYQFKRLSERVRLGLAASSPQQVVHLHQEFAERRLQEIAEVEIASSSNAPVIEKRLDDDFQKDADTAIDQAGQIHLQPDQRRSICQQLLMNIQLLPGPRVQHIEDHCQKFMSTSGDNGKGKGDKEGNDSGND